MSGLLFVLLSPRKKAGGHFPMGLGVGRPIPCRVSVWTGDSKATTVSEPYFLLASVLQAASSTNLLDAGTASIADVATGRLDVTVDTLHWGHYLSATPRRAVAPHNSPSHHC